MTGESANLTCDLFLGGRLRIWQPRQGYRAGIDPVLLAAAVAAAPGETVLELGAGAGVASLCLGSRVAGLTQAALELQPDYAALARRNASDNGIALAVHLGDLRHMPAALKADNFAHVLANPPYFTPGQRTASTDAGRDVARGGETPLGAWVEAAARRLAPGGTLTMILRAGRVDTLIAAAAERLGGLRLLPVQPRAGRDANLVILRARKGSRAASSIAPALILHEGGGIRGAQAYAPRIEAILRDGAPLDF